MAAVSGSTAHSTKAAELEHVIELVRAPAQASELAKASPEY